MIKLLYLITLSFVKSRFALFCFFVFFLLISSNLFSQNTSKTISAPEREWELLKEANGVQVFTQNDECHDFKNGTHYEYIILKFVNTTVDNKKIMWSENLFYNGICSTCDGNSDKTVFELELTSKQTKQGDCGVDNNDILRIFNRFLNYNDKPVLTKYEIVNFEVK
ncbi:MAG: hypothetical protein HY951_14535 [Bacteroidia bacterium]|nr:hypothetical protein [Bacteroidia bacterium]